MTEELKGQVGANGTDGTNGLPFDRVDLAGTGLDISDAQTFTPKPISITELPKGRVGSNGTGEGSPADETLGAGDLKKVSKGRGR